MSLVAMPELFGEDERAHCPVRALGTLCSSPVHTHTDNFNLHFAIIHVNT